MKKLLLILFLSVLALAIGMLTRTLLHTPRNFSVHRAPALKLDQKRVCERLGKAIRIPSVSAKNPDAVQSARLQRMLDFVLESFAPATHAMDVERHPYGLVLRWRGTDPSLAPLLLLAHLDVVPVAPGSESEWNFPPFSGTVAAGLIWGRGALDDKSCALAMLEAAERMLTAGERPRRSVIFSFGLDEEIGGELGAEAQAARFAAGGLEPFLILDEGFAVLDGVIDAVERPVAGIGIAEKGYVTLQLSVSHAGGHTSMPTPQSAIGILAAAITRLESSPAPPAIDGAVAAFFDELAREMPFGKRLLFSNRWLTAPLLIPALDKAPGTAALLRTTCAVTMTAAGVADNVLPAAASATVNLRVHPRESVVEAVNRVRRLIDDPRVTIDLDGETQEPSALSPATGPAWDLLASTIRECYDDVIVAPALVLGGTDSRHYASLSPNVYRFNGLRLGPDDLERIHGIDERITTRNYLEMIRFYLQLLRNA